MCLERNNHIAVSVANTSCKLQNGFVKGRNFLNNVVCLDTLARAYAIALGNLSTPLFLTYDIEAAFPSVAHEWLFAVLIWIGCP